MDGRGNGKHSHPPDPQIGYNVTWVPGGHFTALRALCRSTTESEFEIRVSRLSHGHDFDVGDADVAGAVDVAGGAEVTECQYLATSTSAAPAPSTSLAALGPDASFGDPFGNISLYFEGPLGGV